MPDDLPPRIKAKIRVDENGCWIWLGGTDRPGGYGRVKWQGKMVTAHRLVRHILVQDISIVPLNRKVDVIDHLCLVKSCVNPDHLEVVSAHENNKRHPLLNPGKVYCHRGHLLPKDGPRACKECKLITQRQRRRKAKSA
jgi:HNH endonuclease